jgi:hypothetical protein
MVSRQLWVRIEEVGPAGGLDLTILVVQSASPPAIRAHSSAVEQRPFKPLAEGSNPSGLTAS